MDSCAFAHVQRESLAKFVNPASVKLDNAGVPRKEEDVRMLRVLQTTTLPRGRSASIFHQGMFLDPLSIPQHFPLGPRGRREYVRWECRSDPRGGPIRRACAQSRTRRPWLFAYSISSWLPSFDSGHASGEKCVPSAVHGSAWAHCVAISPKSCIFASSSTFYRQAVFCPGPPTRRSFSLWA
jgi:hypothetical protein